MFSQVPEIEKLEVGKVYEIEYVIPDRIVVDTELLRDMLAEIHTNLIQSPDFRYVDSKLIGNIFKLQFTLRQPTTLKGFSALPVILGYVLVSAVITALAGLGLKWTVKSIKEVVTPITEIAKGVIQPILPIALIIGSIFVVPPLLKYLGKKK